jgi:hypothetical protein
VLNERICYLAIVAQGGFEGWAYRTEEEVGDGADEGIQGHG